MSYQVLARKWRPRAFKDMVGQEYILRMLANALDQKRLHHAYLFTGTRGVGKTTVARILAKSLNCELGITSSPCGTCAMCQSVDNGQCLDLFEVDAASRTKVEDTRELLENVLYPPTQGRFKIYLIDEVHMLSNHSFNALLKTLEEPPQHVKFLLATTDPKRLPITILSRCLQFHLKRIAPEQITQHLQHICETEKLSYDIAALSKLSVAADGSMRDALSLLDQAIAYSHGKIEQQDVNEMLGNVAQEDLLPMIDAIALQNGNHLFSHIRKLAERAPNFQQVLEELVSFFHQIALAQLVPEIQSSDHPAKTFATRFSPEDVQLYYQIALLGRRDLALTSSPQQGFEMTMLRMLAFKPSTQSEHVLPTNTKSKSENAKSAIKNQVEPILETKTEIPTEQTSSTLAHWRDILPKLGLSGMAQALALNCVLEKIDGDKVKLALSEQHQPMLNSKLKERIRDALSQYLNRNVDLSIQITSDQLTTPVKLQQAEHETLLQQAKQRILENPQVKNLIEMCDATLEVSLVTR